MSDTGNVLHVMHATQLAAPFIDFVDSNGLRFHEQRFFCIDDRSSFSLPKHANVLLSSNYASWFGRYRALLREMYRARKIILHGLWGAWIVRLLAAQPWLLPKCYWIIWGGDLYAAKMSRRNLLWYLHEAVRRVVIRRFGHLVTYLEGDVRLAREWYGARGAYHSCLVYPSNLFKDHAVPRKFGGPQRLLLGNSADPANEHREILDALEPFKGEDIVVYAPLSYGDPAYAGQIAALGRQKLGDSFVPMLEFLPAADYVEFLAGIDVAVFNHRRQQAMGNVITLLGLGKKVCLRQDITTWEFLAAEGITVFPIDEHLLTPIDDQTRQRNIERVRRRFSAEVLRDELEELLNG